MSKKRPLGGDSDKSARGAGNAASKGQATAAAPADAPFVLTLRDVQVPLPATDRADPLDSGLVLSDAHLRPEPYLGDPDADRAEQRDARRAQVREIVSVTPLPMDRAPEMLVLSATSPCDCVLLRAFGFGGCR